MKVFVTGATGWIGSVTVKELLGHGHQVVGLARSDASADALKELGAEVHRGDLEDVESLKAGAAACDGVIHLGFMLDFSDVVRGCVVDRAAISALAEGLGEGSGKPLVVASGTLTLAAGFGSIATKQTVDNTDAGPLVERVKSTHLVKQLSTEKRIRGIVVRLSPSVHGKGDQGFVTMVGAVAQKNGEAMYVIDKNASWPAVHRLDAAVLLRLALEKGEAGAIYHAVAEQEVSLKSLAEVIARKLNLPLKGQTESEAQRSLGFIGYILGAENPVSSDWTQKQLGWKPAQLGLLEDVEANYFLNLDIVLKY